MPYRKRTSKPPALTTRAPRIPTCSFRLRSYLIATLGAGYIATAGQVACAEPGRARAAVLDQPSPLKVTIVLEEGAASRAVAEHARAYFAEVKQRLGFPVSLDLAFDSDPAKRALVDQWRKLVQRERQRNPQMPLEFPDDQRSAGFFGPMLVIGRDRIAASLDDETLRQAHRVQHEQPVPTATRPPSRTADPRVAEHVRAALQQAVPPPRSWSSRASLPLALLTAAMITALLWWIAVWSTNVTSAASETATASPPPRRKQRRRR